MAKAKKQKPVFSEAQLERLFPVVEVEQISLEDSFIVQHQPTSRTQSDVYFSIVQAKKNGMKNFRAPAIDPSFEDDGRTIIYKVGGKPAVGKSPEWWSDALVSFLPSKKSRMGTDTEYDVRLGTIIKYLVEEKGYKVADAWYAVCNDSRELGYYWNSDGTEHTIELLNQFEPTGSRPVGKWFDLANTSKIIRSDKVSAFLLAGGFCYNRSELHPLADMKTMYYPDERHYNCVGWMVMDV